MSWTDRPSLPVGRVLTADDMDKILDRLDLSTYNLNSQASAGTTTSSSYADMPGTSFITGIVKKGSDTQSSLHIDATIDCFSTGTNTVIAIGVFIGGADRDLVPSFTFNTANQHSQITGKLLLPSGTLIAGSYSANLRWKRVSGAGTLTIAGTDSCYSMTIEEKWL